MHLLYPTSPLRSKQPDEQFAPEEEADRVAGFELSLFSLEDFQGGAFRAFPPLPPATDIIYRGWMMSAVVYEALVLRRYFVLEGVPHAASNDVPPIVHECARRLRGRFYSVAVVQRADGRLRIVEVGDGQVSDLLGWTPEQFAGILAKHFTHDHRTA